jgi:signal transduction histidine kinase/DNA-binding response OmpR family regulator
MTAKVLIVDDEVEVLRMCQRLLEQAGFWAIPVTNSSQALAVLEREDIDIMLVDVHMPGVGGFQLINLARRIQPQVAVVMISGYGTVETAIEALYQGADDLILKPFGSEELVERVKRALQTHQQKQDLVRLHALRPLFDITETLFAHNDPATLRSVILKAVNESLNCSGAALYRLSKDAAGLEWTEQNSPIPLVEFRPLFNEMVLPAAQRREWLRVNIEENQYEAATKGLSSPLVRDYMNRYKLRSILCAPVADPNGVTVLLAVRHAEKPAFRGPDVEMFVILTRQGAAALENARLYARLRSSLDQLEKSQRALVQAEKMVAAGRLVASIAHEINNPLQALSNCMTLISRPELKPADRDAYVNLAQSELDRLMNTVQRMLDLYRPGKLERRLEDINEIVRKVIMLVDHQLQRSNVQILSQLDQNLPVVMVVASQIQQVLLNLILNSMEAMPNGGMITIQTRQSSSGSDRSGQAYVEILVADTGPGISPESRERLFEPFVSTKETGTGLGLAVSYGILQAHGGAIDLVSEKTPGACFRIQLPVERVENNGKNTAGR